MTARCSICDSPLPAARANNPWRPFCSERCKLIDLSKWLGEEYRVPGPALGDGGPLGISDDSMEHE